MPENLARRRPVLAYFLMTFVISWTGALLVAAPALLGGHALSKQGGILMFPVMILGPCVSGILLTRSLDGPGAVGKMFARMQPRRAAPRWYLALIIPPVLILSVLFLLSRFVSAQFAPDLFLQGIFFGIPAGFVEEIGWTGYAFPRMIRGHDAMAESVWLGLLWGLWHLPVIDYLGAASPQGAYVVPFFLAFTTALTGLRAIIGWLYANTGSLLLAQLMHVSSTGALVAFSPAAVTARGEAFWYSGYAAALWALVALLLIRYRGDLTAKARVAGGAATQ